MTSVVIADDHVLFADGVSRALAAVPDIEVLGTAANGRVLVDMLEDLTPDVLLVDLEMPELDGLGALEELGAGHAPAIVVTMHATAERREAARSVGAAGFLSKSTPLPDLAAAIRAAAAGETILEPATLREILDGYQEAVLDPAPAIAHRTRARAARSARAGGILHRRPRRSAVHLAENREESSREHLRKVWE